MESGPITTATDIILQAAWEAGTDVLLLQEPWTARKDNEWLTKSHPGFIKYVPPSIGIEIERPRSAIYTLMGKRSQQLFLCGNCPDFTSVIVEGVTFASVYRAPGTEWNHLLAWTPTGPTIIGVDFNAVNTEWQPLATSQHGDGQGILERMTDNEMSLASLPGVATHSRGNALDLIWSNSGALADIAPELDTTSDHITLAGEVSRPNLQGSETLRMSWPLQVKDSSLEDFLRVIEEWMRGLGQHTPRSIQEVDKLADDLVQAFGDAIKATGRRDAIKSGRSAQWWTQECKEARDQYKTCGDRESKKIFRSTVAKAKRNYWQSRFANIKSDADMYRLTRWAKPRANPEPAPIKTATGYESNPRRRACLLRDTLLGRFTNEDDLREDYSDEPSMGTLPWETFVTNEEARWFATDCKDKAPGADGITVRLIKTAWPVVGNAVRLLYENSLRFRHFPTAFKLVEVVLIPKPKRDLTDVK